MASPLDRPRATAAPERPGGSAVGDRVGEERAKRILERAAALDAKRSSEIEIGQLREAASAAGIAPEAFDEAIREYVAASTRRVAASGRAPGAAEVEHFAGLFKDLLGEDVQITVREGVIEGKDAEGVSIALDPRAADPAAALVAEGSLKSRLLAIGTASLVPLFLGFILAFEDEGPGIGWMLGSSLTALASCLAIAISHRREQLALGKKVERLRRQLQRMMGRTREED